MLRYPSLCGAVSALALASGYRGAQICFAPPDGGGGGQSSEEFVKAVKAEVKSTYDALDKKTSDLAEAIDAAKKLIGEKASTTDIDGRIKDMQAEIKKSAERADEIERKANRLGLMGPARGEETKHAADIFAEDEGFKAIAKKGGGNGTVNIECKAITTPAAPSARHPLVTTTQAPMVTRVDRPLMVRDLIPSGPVSTNLIEYGVAGPLTNNAAVTAEGALKPESALAWSMAQAATVTIAHWIPVAKQVYDDVPMLRSYIDSELRVGLEQVEENELLLGAGTTGHMNGLYTQRTAYSATGIPGGTSADVVDHVRWAKLQVRKSFFPATGVVLNPEDWAEIEMMKDADGRYLHAAVTSGAEPRLWGMRVVESDALAPGTFLVGAFALAAKIWDREQANVQISSEDRDNFVKNMLTLRGEERLALTVYRPSAFVGGAIPAQA
ncbi:MAG: phage major capsid protein [Ancylobacter novellus]|uniref:Phage major capsid protein n=1 Tax=Ancylobacter novellus TaxID=921 RepID=A0A2W5KW23_ANCNO|nr:MAG: phage major capsid protein [Ancylobacter novellus]